MRAVLDVNVLISSLLAPEGRPAILVRRWLAGDFELVASERLLTELARALSYPKLRMRVPDRAAMEFVDLLRSAARMSPDRRNPPRRSRDSGDDYLIALAEDTASILVTGDQDLLDIRPNRPILAPAAFLAKLQG